jgi:pimeloyl-ACP methyl ester carboxylesterase
LFPKTEQQFQQLLKHNREVGLNCLDKAGDMVRHMDTVSVARDHEALRLALGENKINWLGISYGTQLAANYAQLYPNRTQAMVLDAPLEHSQAEVHQVAGRNHCRRGLLQPVRRLVSDPETCALRGQDVRAVFDRLVQQADHNPIQVEGALRPVTGEDIRMGTYGPLVFKEPSIFGPDKSWAGLSRALQKAIDVTPPPSQSPQQGSRSTDTTACSPTCAWTTCPGAHLCRDATAARAGPPARPHLQGASQTWLANFCIDWPVKPVNPPKTLNVRGVPTLLIHAAHDPSDSYTWAHGLAAQIDGSALLTRTGDGHTSVFTSDCAKSAMDAFLIERRSEANRICEG